MQFELRHANRLCDLATTSCAQFVRRQAIEKVSAYRERDVFQKAPLPRAGNETYVIPTSNSFCLSEHCASAILVSEAGVDVSII
jgi:hypothetical protein